MSLCICLGNTEENEKVVWILEFFRYFVKDLTKKDLGRRDL